jgi:hypothetical protein
LLIVRTNDVDLRDWPLAHGQIRKARGREAVRIRVSKFESIRSSQHIHDLENIFSKCRKCPQIADFVARQKSPHSQIEYFATERPCVLSSHLDDLDDGKAFRDVFPGKRKRRNQIISIPLTSYAWSCMILPMGREVEKLIEYRTAHYAAASEASTYLTNQRASVSFRFANPILCRMITGYKIMSVDQSDPFPFRPGEAILVPPHNHFAIIDKFQQQSIERLYFLD